MANTTDKFWVRTKQFFDSKTWRIIKDILELALFIYLLINAIGRFSSTKGYVGAWFWVLGILMAVADLIGVLRGKQGN